MEKKKKLGAPRLGSIPFLLIWMAAHIGVWLLLLNLAETRGSDDFSTLVLFGLVMGVGLALMQKGLIQFTYHARLKWWLRVTVLGWVIGWLVFNASFELIENLVGNLEDHLGLMLLPLFVIPAVMQWFVLRRNARQAWLWIVAGAVSAMAFGTLFGDQFREETIQFILGAAAQGAVTGLSLLWLYGQARAEKIKAGAV